jgi:hypothetical protein
MDIGPFSAFPFWPVMHDIERKLVFISLSKRNGRHQSVESLFKFKHG